MNNPKQYAKVPQKYGRENMLVWRKVQPTDQAKLNAAIIQHECSLEIRSLARSKYGSIREYCKHSQQNYQRISKVLSGTSVINVEDIGNAIAYLGLSVKFASEYSKYADEAMRSLAGHTSKRDEVGAFYTPEVIARYMASKINIQRARSILEPSFGDGVFLAATIQANPDAIVTGVETDKVACRLAKKANLLGDGGIVNTDFFKYSLKNTFDCVIGNPPYVRLRTLPKETVNAIRASSPSAKNVAYGMESSLWLPFLLKSIDHLNERGNLAFVLPFEITYVKYARDLWTYLGEHFSQIEIMRVKDRIFNDILQDVVLLFLNEKGGSCDCVTYSCYETIPKLIDNDPAVRKKIQIEHIVSGSRAFQLALAPEELHSALMGLSKHTCRVSNEVSFHIGYVCGNKVFFHPSEEIKEQFNLPDSSLHPTALSTRQLSSFPLMTSRAECRDRLWVPNEKLSKGELRYIAAGEDVGVNATYKCRIRNPWYIVPAVKIPALIMSVFCDAPRIMGNDARWTFSNSLLGAYSEDILDIEAFLTSWYTGLTLLSAEIEIHALGGGVLVAVPDEANNIIKVESSPNYASNRRLEAISSMLENNDIDGAYHVGDDILEEQFGIECVDRIWYSIDLMRTWRKRR